MHLLMQSRVWHCAILPHTDRSLRVLSALPPIPIPNTLADAAYCHLELFLCIAMATYWLPRKESFPVAHARRSRHMVD